MRAGIGRKKNVREAIELGLTPAGGMCSTMIGFIPLQSPIMGLLSFYEDNFSENTKGFLGGEPRC